MATKQKSFTCKRFKNVGCFLLLQRPIMKVSYNAEVETSLDHNIKYLLLPNQSKLILTKCHAKDFKRPKFQFNDFSVGQQK